MKLLLGVTLPRSKRDRFKAKLDARIEEAGGLSPPSAGIGQSRYATVAVADRDAILASRSVA